MTDQDGAVNILFDKEIKRAKNKETKRPELVKDYAEEFTNPYIPARLRDIDKIIFPHET